MIKILELGIQFFYNINFVYWAIIFSLFFSVYYIFFRKKELINPYIFDSIPSTFTSLGIIGTFLGIANSLIYFDTGKITESIPMLLEGLKTAFYTSILGIILSLIFSRFIEYQQNRMKLAREIIDIGNNNGNMAKLSMAIDQLNSNNKENSKLLEKTNTLLKENLLPPRFSNDPIKGTEFAVKKMADLQNNQQNQLEKLVGALTEISKDIKKSNSTLESFIVESNNGFDVNKKNNDSDKVKDEGKFKKITSNLLFLGFIEKITNIIILLKFLRFW